MAAHSIPSEVGTSACNQTPNDEKPQLTASPPPLPTQKLSALARLKSFTGSLSLKNKYTRSQDDMVFPPPSWFIDDNATDLGVVGVSGESMRHSPPPEAQAQPSSNRAAEALEAPEPVSFAMKIKQLIDSLPLPTLTRASTLGLTSHKSTATANQESNDLSGEIPKDGRGPPILAVVDAKLMKLLSSESVMNGGTAKEGDQEQRGSYRESVWSVLERLRPGRIGGGEAEGREQKDGDIGDRAIEGGVMMYSPLEPTPDSEVELAESELEYVDPEEPHNGGADGETEKGKGKEQEPAPAAPAYEKVWVPSTTKLSFYTAWWGYRLYLPPPVMEKLGSTNVKATARAAIITTALKWFLDRLPLMMVPPTLKPAVILLKRLSPLIGYIGVFISWSWARITTYDEGNGVVLTATWLLPVALIPSSWNAGDIHGPSARPLDEDEQRAITPKSDQKKKGRK